MKTISSILKRSKIERGNKLNILCAPTHERFSECLAATGHNFYLFCDPVFKQPYWDHQYATLPENIILLDESLGPYQIPSWLDIDILLAQNRWGQIQLFKELQQQYHIPLIFLEHTIPNDCTDEQIRGAAKNRGDINVFLWHYSERAWLAQEYENRIIPHGMDHEFWSPNNKSVDQKNQVVFSCVNDWIKRDEFCGWNLYQQSISGLPVLIKGKTPGVSVPAKDTNELRKFYRNSRVFLNTSLVSSLPMSLIEAALCECACVSTSTCAIPELFTDGHDCIFANTPDEINAACKLLLQDDELATRLGKVARETVIQKLSVQSFVDKWNDVFYDAVDLVYKG